MAYTTILSSTDNVRVSPADCLNVQYSLYLANLDYFFAPANYLLNIKMDFQLQQIFLMFYSNSNLLLLGLRLQKHVCATKNNNSHVKIDFKKNFMKNYAIKIKLQSRKYLLEEFGHSLTFWAKLCSLLLIEECTCDLRDNKTFRYFHQ